MNYPRSEGAANAKRWTRKSLADRTSELLASLESQMDILSGGSEEARRLADELRNIVDEIRQALENASTSQA